MADDSEEFEECLENVLSVLREKGFKIQVKAEQKTAVKQLYEGKDLLAVLPTGYGKSLIFQLLVMMAQRRASSISGSASVLVICPLTSIINDQILEVESMGLSACNLTEKLENLHEVEAGNYQIVYTSAESAIDKRFLDALKKDSRFTQSLVACIVDESHTLETWTGLRDTKSKTKGRKDTIAFRGAYGELSILRSFLRGIPMAAMTGTADDHTCAIVSSQLALRDYLTVHISPNRENLRFSVKKTSKDSMFSELDWLIDLVKEKGESTDKTLIFCNTMNDIASVVNYLMLKLGKAAYHTQDTSYCLIGIYHSSSWQRSKERIVKSFKGKGKIRIVVASTALSMGVNFPDVRFVINWGPARNLLDLHQEAGRAGRDGLLSHHLVVYHGQQLSHCEEQVKMFVRASGCLRIAAYKTLDDQIKSLEPGHCCCTQCSLDCKCNSDSCLGNTPIFEQAKATISENLNMTRPVSNDDKSDLMDALNEVRDSMATKPAVFDKISCHGFSTHLVEDVVKHCYRIFTIGDILDTCPVYSLSHALKILEVIQEVFLDIPNFDETLSVLQLDNHDYDCPHLEDVLDNFALEDMCYCGEDDPEELHEVLT